MSLFGLFHVAFGLGTLAKDAISDSIDDVRSREKAEREGRPTYSVNGYKVRSTQTGKDAYIDYGFRKTDHIYVRDRKTNQIIEDITLKKNATNQLLEIKKAKENGSIFYRTTQFDSREQSRVYVCDTIPGYFREEMKNGEKLYTEGKLISAYGGYRVDTEMFKDGEITYYNDGSVYSISAVKEVNPNPFDNYEYEHGIISKDEYDERTKKNKKVNISRTYYKKGEKYL